jgi:hypothetical protein
MIDFIDRLEGVKEHGGSHWTARCPAHADKSPSLSVTQTHDGMWLIHCFAGCSPLDIIAAIGLRFEDLFPDAPVRDRRPPGRPRLSAGQRLALIETEVQIIYIAGCDIRLGNPLQGEDHRRLEKAMARIVDVMGYGR